MDAFEDIQRRHFVGGDPRHLRFQTTGYVGATEAALLDEVAALPGDRLLEIGCGDGGNLHHLRARGVRLVGVDYTHGKAQLASRVAPAARADAAHLPFADGAFDAVLIRDLLHHVDDRMAVLVEAARVLRPGGRITVIEPNGKNPLIVAQAAAIRAERGMLRSTALRLTGELERAGLRDLELRRAQPLPISRLLLHPDLGAPILERLPGFTRALGRVEHALARLPSSTWAYLIVRGIKP